MRSARIKVDGLGYYHCMSRVMDRRVNASHAGPSISRGACKTL